MNTPPPTVLVFAGNDPSGGAGLCADIQALTHAGCHTLPVVTCTTVQNTMNVLEKNPLTGRQIIAQAEAVLDDIPVTVCKIGLLGSVDIVLAVRDILLKYPHLTVVLDPILAAGGGHSFATGQIRDAMVEYLLPLTDIATPNSQEVRALAGVDSLQEAALNLLSIGCRYVCVTGTHEESVDVQNILFDHSGQLQAWQWPRLVGSYHGSGCTFASSLAGFLAQGQEIITAVYQAQSYTWHSLQRGYSLGKGQLLPRRL